MGTHAVVRRRVRIVTSNVCVRATSCVYVLCSSFSFPMSLGEAASEAHHALSISLLCTTTCTYDSHTTTRTVIQFHAGHRELIRDKEAG